MRRFDKRDGSKWNTLYCDRRWKYRNKRKRCDAVAADSLEADVIYAWQSDSDAACDQQYAQEKGIECYISMEERMACGIGACLGWCPVEEVDDHSHVHNKRVCKD